MINFAWMIGGKVLAAERLPQASMIKMIKVESERYLLAAAMVGLREAMIMLLNLKRTMSDTQRARHSRC